MTEENLDTGTENTQSQTETLPDVDIQQTGNTGDQGQQESQQGEPNKVTSIPYNRFQEVNTQKNQYKDQVTQFQKDNEQLRAALQSLTGGVKQPVTSDGAPNRSQYPEGAEGDAKFVDERYKWNKTQDEQAAKESQGQDQYKAAANNFNTKCTEVKAKYNDFDQVMEACPQPTDPNVALALMKSDVAGDLSYAYAKNQARIAALPVAQQLIEIGKLDAGIPRSNGQPNRQSSMPSPIDTVGSGKINSKPEWEKGMSNEQLDQMYPIE